MSNYAAVAGEHFSAAVQTSTQIVPFNPKKIDKLFMPDKARMLEPSETTSMEKLPSFLSRFKDPKVKEKQKQAIIMDLLDAMKKVIGDGVWRSMKKDTKQALRALALLCTDRGFTKATDQWFANQTKFKVSERTIQKYVKIFKDSGLIYVANFKAKGRNGKEGRAIFFMNHPYFSKWARFLKLTFKCETECETDHEEIPCGSKNEDDKTDSNIGLPHFKKKQNTYVPNTDVPSSQEKVVVSFEEMRYEIIASQLNLNLDFVKTFKILHLEFKELKKYVNSILRTMKKYSWSIKEYQDVIKESLFAFLPTYKKHITGEEKLTEVEPVGYLCGIIKKKIESVIKEAEDLEYSESMDAIAEELNWENTRTIDRRVAVLENHRKRQEQEKQMKINYECFKRDTCAYEAYLDTCRSMSFYDMTFSQAKNMFVSLYGQVPTASEDYYPGC